MRYYRELEGIKLPVFYARSILVESQCLAHRRAHNHAYHCPQGKDAHGNERNERQPQRKWNDDLCRNDMLDGEKLIFPPL